MTYFYCQSYQAFNLALTLSSQSEVTIITSASNIIRACEFLKIPCLSHQPFTAIQMLRNRKAVNKEISRLISIVKSNPCHFSHTQYAYFSFYLFKSLVHLNANTVFHNFELLYNKTSINSVFRIKYLKARSIQILLSRLYNLKLETRQAEIDNYVISLNLNYINANCTLMIDDKDTYYETTLKFFKECNIDFPEIKNLFIAQHFGHKEASNIYLNDCLRKLDLNSNSIKLHPKLKNISILGNCNKLPEFLPVELFFNKVKGKIVSIHSASLVTASKFDHVKTISLLDVINENDPFLDQMKLDLISKSNSKIFFPKSKEEFLTLIDS